MTLNDLHEELSKKYLYCNNSEIDCFPSSSPSFIEGFIVRCKYTNSIVSNDDYCSDCPNRLK